MAISTVKITDTIEFAKKLMFNRNPVIGNSLEPALTAANMIKQVILGPPFEWWWNNEEIVFTTSSIANASTSPATVQVATSVLSVSATNNFYALQPVLASGFTGTASPLNGLIFQVSSANASFFNAITTLSNFGPAAAQPGVFTGLTTQDYSIATPEFSHIEHCSVYDPTAKKWFEMEVRNNLGLDNIADRPRFLNPHTEDGNGNMTWRVMPAPDQNYPVSIHIQLASTEVSSVNATWAPIPDYMQYVYNWGFLALMWLFSDDSRFQLANQKFTSSLLARAQGLTEEEKNTFLNNWNALTGTQQMQMQQGIQARGQ